MVTERYTFWNYKQKDGKPIDQFMTVKNSSEKL